MKTLTITIVLGTLICSLMYLSFIFGEKSTQNEIEKRALQLNKDCYNITDIEIIIFNENQL